MFTWFDIGFHPSCELKMPALSAQISLGVDETLLHSYLLTSEMPLSLRKLKSLLCTGRSAYISFCPVPSVRSVPMLQVQRKRAVPWIGVPGLLYIALCLLFKGAIMRVRGQLNDFGIETALPSYIHHDL
ncbi:hypothetical protein BGW80DRAFT_1444571 [Lactifluus volemus]|nr:hypothetical protein BGW80DRAFT_1444571 [Lactifluus volemus]